MIYPVNFIVYDLETSGLSAEKHQVIEVAFVVLDYQMNVIKEYESLIRPYGNLLIEQQALEVNKISIQEINSGKDVKLVVKELYDIFKSLKSGKYAKPILVGHNITGFDNNFLIKMFEFGGKNIWDVVDKNVEDTMYLSRYKWYDDSIANFKLTTCCNKAGIELVQAHRAMHDTKATARLFTELIKSLRLEGSMKKQERVREKFRF